MKNLFPIKTFKKNLSKMKQAVYVLVFSLIVMEMSSYTITLFLDSEGGTGEDRSSDPPRFRALTVISIYFRK